MTDRAAYGEPTLSSDEPQGPAATAAFSTMQHAHYPGLDTLRSVAILLVILCHAKQTLGGKFFGPVLKDVFSDGWVGVDLFFVLSGFLIASQLLQSIKRDGRVHFGRFYLKRSLRILPSYYAVLLLYYVWPPFREKPEIDPAWNFMLFFMNYSRVGEGFSHAWSLCVEEHFYLVFPSIAAICSWRPQLFRPALIIAAVILGEPALRFYLWQHGAAFYPAVYRPSHTHLDGLTIGVTLALLREFRGPAWQKLVAHPWSLTLGGVALVACGLYKDFPVPILYVFSFSFVAFGFGALVAAALSPGFWLSRTRIPGAAFVAALAFTLYLTHKQMIHLAATIVGEYQDRPVLTVVLSVVLIVLASCLLHFAIERPFLRLRDRILKRTLAVKKSVGVPQS